MSNLTIIGWARAPAVCAYAARGTYPRPAGRAAAPKTIYACALATSITFDPDSKQAEGSNHAQPNINRIGPLNDAQDISAL